MSWRQILSTVTLALGVIPAACGAGTSTASPTPPAPTSATRTPSQTTAPPTATRASPTPTAPATRTLIPAVCASERGGTAGVSRTLAAVRAAHQPGFDRVVFDFGSGPMPAYVVEQAREFIGPSGMPTPVQGNAFIGVRFPQAGESGSYRGPRTFQLATGVVREVKVVEDFEGQLVWGIGLERHECPRVSVFSAPARLVLDFPTQP